MYDLRLIGYPISHSLSPWIHKQFIERAKVEGSYTIHEIMPDESFAEEIEKLKHAQVDGFNITVPYKQKIIPYVDRLNVEARSMGAVNTVVYRDGKWIGYNTDGRGYLRALYHKYPEVQEMKDKQVLLLGAGGAARGIYYALIEDGFKQVDIANRTIESATNIQALSEGKTETNILHLEEAEENLGAYDLVIQTTSVGMRPHTEQSIISLHHLTEGTIASDIVYQPLQTKFLREAKKKNAKIHYGHSMLLYQAQYSFEIWTGKIFDITHMDEKMKQELKGR